MTATPQYVTTAGADRLSATARDHLWMHFTRHSAFEDGGEVPVIVRGEGAYIWDSQGRRYLDGLSGLFVVQAGHGRVELAEAAAKQATELAFFPLWSYAHPTAITLSERLAAAAPGDLNRVFFTTGGRGGPPPGDLNGVFFTPGGGEAVESVWKLAKQNWKLRGKPMKHKVISRA